MHNLFDAHCHMQDERLGTMLPDVLARAAQQQVTAMMCCATQENDWEQVLALGCIHNELRVSLGVHPWYAATITDGWQSRLCAHLFKNPCTAVGEIGLDFALDASSHEQQESIFIEQLKIAREYNRPVSLHCCRAFGRLAEILSREGGVIQGGMLHSYSGSADMVPVFEKLGLYISFSGSITYTEHKRTRAAAAVVSLHRLLIETDSPDICPAEVTGKYNEPANLIYIARALAEVRNCTISEIAAQTFANAQRLFSCASAS
jgi:TatD DNase family protein